MKINGLQNKKNRKEINNETKEGEITGMTGVIKKVKYR